MDPTAWPEPDPSTLDLAAAGDSSAIGAVLTYYREQLKVVVRTRLDGRLRGRFDESDVVNEVLTTACQSVPKWLKKGLPLYACLHTLTRNQLVRCYRDHVQAQKRSVTREAPGYDLLSSQSVLRLCNRLRKATETPSRILDRAETQRRVREAIAKLPETDREVVIMRALEATPSKEVAAALQLTEKAVNVRYMRALQRLRAALSE